MKLEFLKKSLSDFAVDKGLFPTPDKDFSTVTSDFFSYIHPKEHKSFLMKIPSSSFSEAYNLNENELKFYSRLADGYSKHILNSTCDSIRSTRFLILPDLRESHYALSWPTYPTSLEIDRIGKVVAEFHANSMAKAHSQLSGGNLRNTICENEYSIFLSEIEDRVDRKSINLMQNALNQSPSLEDIISTNSVATNILGDCHPGNILFAVNDKDEDYIIDFQHYTYSTPLKDLANFLYANSSIDYIKRAEPVFINSYSNRGSINNGQNLTALVAAYFLYDTIHIPFYLWKLKVPANYWWYKLDFMPELYRYCTGKVQSTYGV